MQLMSLYNQSVQLASACGVRSQCRLVSRTLSSVCGARTQRRSGSRALFESFESIPSTKRQSMLVRSHRSRGSSQVEFRVTSSLSQCLQFGQDLSKKERLTLLAQCAHLAHVTRYRDALADSSRISRISRVLRNSCFFAMEFTVLWLQLTQLYALWHLAICRGRETFPVLFGLATYVMYVSLCMAGTSCVQLTPVVRVLV